MPVEFTCCECGRQIFTFTMVAVPVPPLCMMCQTHPLWFQDPELRAVLDPEHDGRDRSVLPPDPDEPLWCLQ